ncbi:MAG: phenylacetate--CoA ligase [Bacteroidaceae bacterium]|nr:phenylacetate--CoA ligase [Bacteroidaceae bacterium]
MIWNREIECMPREKMRVLQGEKLKRIVAHAYNNSLFYRRKFDEYGIRPEDISSIDDIVKLPFTVKHDLRDNYPFGMMAVPMSDIIRIHASSGTTGKPIVVGYTEKDLENWSEAVARCLTSFGLDSSDLIQIAYGYGLFTGGLGLHYGVQRIGATVIPAGTGNTVKQLQMMSDFSTSALACTPSYAMYMAEKMNKYDIPVDSLSLRIGIFGAEPWTENMRREIQDKLHIKAYDIYGLTEISGPGVGGECECQNGIHISEDLFYPEIVDPVTLESVGPGQRGELVFTTLDKWGMPMIRYRTRDLTTLNYETCECGRTTVRMGKILGRSDDMLIVRGVNVFPSQVESILLEFPEYEPYFLIEVDRINNTDTFQIQVEVKPEFYTDKINQLVRIKERLTSRIQNVIGIQPEIKIVQPNTIERSTGKSKRAIDHRKFE